MGFFHRSRSSDARGDSAAPGPVLTAPPGWTAVSGTPFDGHLEGAVAEINRARHHAGRDMISEAALRVGDTVFRDVYRTSVEGRTVTVANAWTEIENTVQLAQERWRACSVVAVELPAVFGYAGVRPRQLPADHPSVTVAPTGDPAFDAAFVVTGTPDPTPLMTAGVRAGIAVRDDWYVRFERYLMACVGAGLLRSPADVTGLAGQALAIVAALPATIVPPTVDHSADDIIARAMKLTTLDEGLQFLQGLTPQERATLAGSSSPLAALADARTPAEAMQRFKTLDPAAKMALMAQFMRVKDAGH